MASRSDDALAEGVGGFMAVALVLAIIVAIWLAVKATELVIRVMVAHPTNKPMWVMLAVFLASVLTVVLSEGKYFILNATALASLAALHITAKAVELHYDQLLQTELSRDLVIHEVFHEPWWNAA